MKALYLVLTILCFISCNQKSGADISVGQIIDSSITVSGGKNYRNSRISFVFRDRKYISENSPGQKLYKRITPTDSVIITDIKKNSSFSRFFDDNMIELPETLANKYANSVNSVHYFSRLPLGLSDAAVNKEFLGKVSIKGAHFYKVKVTFDQENGGEDFEDTYLYWFDTSSMKPIYLAYEFHTDGGGIRFREAYNERYINKIRFVDYNNYKPEKGFSGDFFKIDSLFEVGELELLSKIELQDIKVERLD